MKDYLGNEISVGDTILFSGRNSRGYRASFEECVVTKFKGNAKVLVDTYYDDYRMSNTVQSIFEKMLPLAMEFDDDWTMEAWKFDNGTKRLKDVTPQNIANYVKKNINGSMGGTNYAPVINEIVDFYKNSKAPVYVIFITDGDNWDKDDATAAIQAASRLPIFWQFVGLGNNGYSYLKELDDMTGRYVDNADFFEVRNANDITYFNLLNEFPSWLSNDKVKSMLSPR